MHETLLKCNKNAMHEHITTISQSPTQKIQEKFKNPKIFEKTPKPRFEMHECMKREKIRTLTKCFDLDIG